MPDDQQVMDAFMSAISRYYSPVELTPAIIGEVRETVVGMAGGGGGSSVSPERVQGLLLDSSEGDLMFGGGGSAATTPTSLATTTTNINNINATAHLPISQYVSQALWYNNGPTHWEHPTIYPSHSLPPNPLLDARLLPYALMRLFREIDRSSAD